MRRPPYAYIPGRRPHPTRHTDGHGQVFQGGPEAAWEAGVALFDAGFYWEAHEAWEVAWREAKRADPVGEARLRGLIHLAAAGVKVRERRVSGVIRHARRAEVLLAPDPALAALAAEVAATAEQLVAAEDDAGVRVVFGFRLADLLHGLLDAQEGP